MSADQYVTPDPHRAVTVPHTVSAEAQAAYAGFLGPDGTAPDTWGTLPHPDDLHGWDQWRERNNQLAAAAYRSRLSENPPHVRTVQHHGVTVHVAGELEFPHADRALLVFHGGALVVGDGEAAQIDAAVHAERFHAVAYSVDYRMPPRHPFPAALEDGLTIYRHLLDTYGPSRVGVIGGSAGGNLAAATVVKARDEHLPMPAALVLITPELDLTESGDSFTTNRWLDVVLQPLLDINRMYAADATLTDPYLSPLFADFDATFPSTLLSAGTRDMFLSNAVRMHRSLRRANIDARLHVFEGMPHGLFLGTPEEHELDREVLRFLDELIPTRQRISSAASTQ